MPADDVSDLKDVFDAIDRLCDTMKTESTDDTPQREDARDEPIVRSVEILSVDDWAALSTGEIDEESCDATDDPREGADLTSTFVSAEDISQRVETPRRPSIASLASSEASAARDAQDRWSDTRTSPPSAEYYVKEATQWSECRVSPPGRDEAQAASEPSEVYYTASSEVSLQSDSEPDRREDKEGVMAGHVAAMRERFESMTRANTPCPDAAATSPALDLYRNITPSPDHLA